MIRKRNSYSASDRPCSDRILACALLLLCTVPPALAENTVRLDATFQAAPTEWCPSFDGIPVTITMNGPDIIKGPPNWPRTVKVRRGGTDVRIFDGERTVSFWYEEEVDDTPVGRFSATFNVCQSIWGDPGTASGTWRVSTPDGTSLDEGVFEEERFSSIASPFFRSAPNSDSNYKYATFGERRLFAAAFSIERRQTFAAEPEKE